jgi:hypothetical protein
VGELGAGGKKDSREPAAFVIFNVKTRREGRWMQLECDAGGRNRTQVNGTMTPGYRDECQTVAEKLGFGRILSFTRG